MGASCSLLCLLLSSNVHAAEAEGIFLRREGQGDISKSSESASKARSSSFRSTALIEEEGEERWLEVLRWGEDMRRMAFSCKEQAINLLVAMGPRSACSSIHWNLFNVLLSRKA